MSKADSGATLEFDFLRQGDFKQEIKLYMRRLVQIMEDLIAGELLAGHQYLSLELQVFLDPHNQVKNTFYRITITKEEHRRHKVRRGSLATGSPLSIQLRLFCNDWLINSLLSSGTNPALPLRQISNLIGFEIGEGRSSFTGNLMTYIMLTLPYIILDFAGLGRWSER